MCNLIDQMQQDEEEIEIENRAEQEFLLMDRDLKESNQNVWRLYNKYTSNVEKTSSILRAHVTSASVQLPAP